MKKILFTALFCVIAVLNGFSENVIISQINNTTVLADQTIKVWVSVTDSYNNPVTTIKQEQVSVYEGIPGTELVEREILSFRQGANINEGISILFLLDNSGSMYEDIGGRETDVERQQRIYFAKEAIKDLLRKIKNPADRLSLISFNIKIGEEVASTNDKAQIVKALENIEKPGKGQGYTELYESLYYSCDRFKEAKGRKVIILLTDGRNEAFSGAEHPQFKTRQGLDKALQYAASEGISVFSIGIVEGRNNPDLRRISGETGGVAYEVQNLNQLADLYSEIRDRVLAEYLLTYQATMIPANVKNLKVVVNSSNKNYEADRNYFSATLFGLPQKDFAFWIFLMIPLALLLLLLLARLRFDSRQEGASLDVLTVAGKTKRMSPVTILENKHEVTISASAAADVTIADDPTIGKKEVKVVRTGNEYTVMSSGSPITVNNQKVTSKKLRSGDVITVGESTIVFDGGIGVTLTRKVKSRGRKRKS
ncbi:MAG: VWA domain-containing protein [Spirochaetales bacterium]|nr:VWA domain-containing protein [Spirochaetales bacterium]